MNLPELQVLSAIREGSESAFEMLFKTHYQPLCRYAYSFLNDKDEAEEIVQSAFIQIWNKRQSVVVQTSIKSYLYRMVRNGCLNEIKHARVKAAHVQRERISSEPSFEGASQTIMASELEQKIHEAMKTLPEQCRMVFQLSRFEELKYAEIADQLNLSVKTVENHMGKALKIMRTHLKEYFPLFLFLVNDCIS